MVCPVWHTALTKADRKALDMVWKSALHLIWGSAFDSYESALDALNLEDRRGRLCLNFVMKSALSKTLTGPNNTRNNKASVNKIWQVLFGLFSSELRDELLLQKQEVNSKEEKIIS